MDNPDDKKRRYCLICHTFKPERCHHCSTCGRCVLCMDHHCPWLNNCVGFFNRKYFLQTLFYTWCCLLLGIIGTIPHGIWMIQDLVEYKEIKDPYSIFIFILALVAFCSMVILFGIKTAFISFHIELLNKNSTTIENLEE